MHHLSIAKEFSSTPGARSPDEGPFSGEEFLSEKLNPAFEAALSSSQKLTVNMDGTEGYATSFLEASFGGLARKHGIKTVQDNLVLISEDEPYLIEEVREYVARASET